MLEQSHATTEKLPRLIRRLREHHALVDEEQYYLIALSDGGALDAEKRRPQSGVRECVAVQEHSRRGERWRMNERTHRHAPLKHIQRLALGGPVLAVPMKPLGH